MECAEGICRKSKQEAKEGEVEKEEVNGETVRQRHTESERDGQTDRQTDRQTETHRK